MSTDSRRTQCRSKVRRVAKWGAFTLFGVAVAGAGIYEYQPQRYDLFPRPVPANNPWTDPNSVRLFAGGVRIAVITAHPDDAEFYIGGLLTRLAATGAHVSLIVTTDGDKGYYPFENAAENRRIRRGEQREAAAIWKADSVTFLGYPDGRFFATSDAVARLSSELERLAPEYVLSFDADYPPRLSHRDHRNTGEAVERAIQHSALPCWLLRFSTRAANFAVDVTSEWPQKLALLTIHRSQFSGSKLNFIANVVAGSAHEYGRMLNAELAEGLRCSRFGTNTAVESQPH